MICFLFLRTILHWDHLFANKTISMFHIAIVSYFDSPVINLYISTIEDTDRNDAGKCGTSGHIPKSNENKEQDLIFINPLSQLLVHCTATTFLWSLLECVLNLREKLRQEWLSGCFVIIQFRIVGFKNVRGFFDGVSSLSRGYQDSNTAWILFFF